MSRSSDLPRRLGEILTPALGKLADSDEARAYAAWARAVGDEVARGTRAKAFRRGQLTVECASAVWANELTYLGPQILRRMDEVAPGHPVKGFRFTIGHLQGGGSRGSEAGGHGAPGGAVREAAGQDSRLPAPNLEIRDQQPAQGAAEPARAQAEGVDDERLRAAIEAALRRSSEEPPQASGRGTPGG